MKHSALLIKHSDVVLSIDKDNIGLPALYVTVYFHEDGRTRLTCLESIRR